MRIHLACGALLLALLFSCRISFSQNLSYKHYTVQDGLPSQTIYEAFQDSQGFMWFATSMGVSRFDGYTFTNFTMADGLGDNEIFGFYEDVFQRIWFRSLNGKISYLLHGKIYNASNEPSLKEIDNPSIIRHIVGTPDSSILVTHFTHGIRQYTADKKTFKLRTDPLKSFLRANQLPDGRYNVIGGNYVAILNRDGSIRLKGQRGTFARTIPEIHPDYYGCNLQNIYKLDTTLSTNFAPITATTPLNLPQVIYQANSHINNICTEDSTTIWVCTTEGAHRYNLLTQRPEENIYLKNENIASVLKDNEGNLWFTSLENGIFLLINTEASSYTTDDGLASNKIYSLTADDYGNIWAGHDNFILSQVSSSGQVSQKKLIEYIPEHYRQASKPMTTDIKNENGEFIITTTTGLIYINGNHITLASSLSGKRVSRWYDDIYVVAEGHGIRKISKGDLRKNLVSRLHPSPPINHDVLVSKKFSSAKHLLSMRTISLHLEEDGKLWVGLDNGLLCLTKDTIIHLHETIPALRERIVDIAQDSSGTMFLATDSNGIIIFKKNGETIRLSKKNGLSSDQCNRIRLDGKTLWIATNKGLNRVTLDQTYSLQKIYVVNTADGLRSDFINTIHVTDDKVWAGTPEGLSAIDKSIDTRRQRPPLSYITGIFANNERIDTLLREPLHHEKNNLKIEFVGLSYKSMSNINYRYKLVTTENFSYDDPDQWQETRNTSVDLTLLPPGNYTFAVMAQSANGLWSRPSTYQFIINTPFWQTKWFIIMATFATTAAGFSLWRYVMKAQEKKKLDKRKLQLSELKALRSRMNYHFMSNAFNSLQGLFFSNNGVDQYIGKFSKLMRSTLEYSDRQQIPLAEELEYVKLYCDIEQLRVGNRFTFNIEFEEGLKTDDLIVPALTLQPFVENAIWHGIMASENMGRINLSVISNDHESYKIIIEDNGVGINASLQNKVKTNRKSYGTKLITERFEVIRQQSKGKFDLRIEDLYELNQTNGTRITLVVPYTYDE